MIEELGHGFGKVTGSDAFSFDKSLARLGLWSGCVLQRSSTR